MKTKKQAVKQAVLHKQGTYTPYHAELTQGLQAQVAAHLGLKPGGFAEYANNHVTKCNFAHEEEIRLGIYSDEFGVVWDRTGADKDIGMIMDYAFRTPDINEYTFAAPDKVLMKARCEDFFKAEQDVFAFAKMGTTLFERAWSLRGLQHLMMDFLLEEEFVQQLMEKIADYHIATMQVALDYDFDGVYFGDDYGQQTGLMMSPNVWRKYIKPQLRRMFDFAKAKGKTVCLHSCGNISLVLGDLIDIGLDIYQTVQPEVYDLKTLKREYGKDLSFFGGISTQRDLPSKTPQQIKSIVKQTIEIMSKDGGYIAAPTHRITGDTPVQNVVAMVEAFKEG